MSSASQILAEEQIEVVGKISANSKEDDFPLSIFADIFEDDDKYANPTILYSLSTFDENAYPTHLYHIRFSDQFIADHALKLRGETVKVTGIIETLDDYEGIIYVDTISINNISITRNGITTVLLPPKRQPMDGNMQSVVCPHGYQIVFKATNGNPACVTEQTARDLEIRNWSLRGDSVVILTDKQTYNLGEPITITMINLGSETLKTNSVPIGLSIFDEGDLLVCSWRGPYMAEGEFAPGDKLIEVLHGDEDCLTSGIGDAESKIFRIKADHFRKFETELKYRGAIHEFTVTAE